MDTPHTSPYSAALVTGGAARIGKAISLKLVELGLAVAIHHRNSADEASMLVSDINASGGKAVVVGGDLADTANIEIIAHEAAQKLGMPIDVLINNASVFEEDTLASFTPESFDLHQNVNLRAPLMLSQAIAKALPEERHGCIINMIDQRVLKLNPQFFSYTIAKAGLLTATQTMAQSLAPMIRVNAIGPGPTLANIFQSKAEFEAESRSVLLEKGPKLSEITATIAFLLETPSMTGQMLTLDGGQHLAWRTPDIIAE